jgi:cytochrome c553
MTGMWLSRMRAGVLLAAACGLLGNAPLYAQTALTGNPQRGKQLSYTCLGCHGVEGYRNAYPEYSVPRLKGQHKEYLVAALIAYRNGERGHLTMHDQASSLSDQDIADIASFFAGKPLVHTNQPPAGPPPAAVVLCGSCHGPDGISLIPTNPTLAGQHEDYLVRALNEYRHGGRKNPIMVSMAATLKEGDIETVARFFSRQTPSLSTETRPFSVFGKTE